MYLKEKVAVITGASAGIGRATALLFAQKGANVVAVARGQYRLEALAEEAEPYEGRIIPFVGDISLKSTNESMLEFAVGMFGRLDVLVNNAGVMDDFTPVGDVTDELWSQVMAVNLYGPMTAIRKAVKIMQEQQKGGSIVNVGSVVAEHGGRSGAAYAASKAGLQNLSVHTAFLYADKQIRSNCINPGGVKTGIAINTPNVLGYAKAKLGHATMSRLGEPEEVAEAVAFLASDEAKFINGTILTIDGAWTAY